MAARMEDIAHALCDVADIYRVPLFGMVGTLHQTIYPVRGHRFVAEYYADLDYTDAGGLIITREHPPVDAARAAARCVRAIKDGLTESVGGVDVLVGSDSICIHSDTPNAVELAQAVRAAVAPWLEAA
jgi:5-oxoprolinase (ATP-hydrolysing) subunit A